IILSPNPQLVRLSPNLEKLVKLKIHQNQDVQILPEIKKIDIVLSMEENPQSAHCTAIGYLHISSHLQCDST
ncbi:hypothetical protein NQ318_014555, partial [Aromia moschata]